MLEKEAQLKLLPELQSLLQVRYRILQMIQLSAPIGRRPLSELLNLPEREVRTETERLRKQGLVIAETKGMYVTEVGMEVLETLRPLYYEWSGISELEEMLRHRFGIARVIIVPGDTDEDQHARMLMGQQAANELMNTMQPHDTIAVTGGSSIEAMENFLVESDVAKDVQFIAARGSIGHEMRRQANTLAASFAAKTNSAYKTLYLPENLSEHIYLALKEEPMVKEMLTLYEETAIVVHGIGRADTMAQRRQVSDIEMRYLEEVGAVGEAFGYYFNEKGNTVHKVRAIGIAEHHVKKSRNVLAVAGGKNKASAIRAYFLSAPKQTTFITDEAAAKEILDAFKKN